VKTIGHIHIAFSNNIKLFTCISICKILSEVWIIANIDAFLNVFHGVGANSSTIFSVVSMTTLETSQAIIIWIAISLTQPTLYTIMAIFSLHSISSSQSFPWMRPSCIITEVVSSSILWKRIGVYSRNCHERIPFEAFQWSNAWIIPITVTLANTTFLRWSTLYFISLSNISDRRCPCQFCSFIANVMTSWKFC